MEMHLPGLSFAIRPNQRLRNKGEPDSATRARGGVTKIWLTVIEAADYSGLSRDTIYTTACERRELRHVRAGGRRTIRLKAEWIDAWLEQHARGAKLARVAEPRSAVGGVS
jgi:excisionase family DNA binding protein